MDATSNSKHSADSAKHHDMEVGEKPVLGDHVAGSDGDYAGDSDENKQDGIKKVEAVTTVLSKKTLILIFALFVPWPYPDHPMALARADVETGCTSSASSTPSCSPSRPT